MQQPLEERSGGGTCGSREPARGAAHAASDVVWYRSINRQQWSALVASNLGWFFDGYETYALVLTVGGALGQLLAPAEHAQIPFYAGLVIALTLLGWGIGGLIGGILTDYIGRKRMMMLAILAYSLTTGLSALSWDWTSFAALRFIVGLAMGSEWATGTAMTAEIWPDRHRGKGAGLMQCGLGTGFFVASLIWLFMSGAGVHAWRYMYLIGVLPGLATLWMRAGIPESEQWQRVNAERKATLARRKSGAALDDREQALARFTLVDLLADPKLRRRTWIAVLMSLSTTLGWWGISTWVPPYIGSVAAHAGLPAATWASFAGMAYNIGAISGYIGLGFLADAYGRKATTIGYVALALLSVPVVFLWANDLTLILWATAFSGAFVSGQYTWMAAWLPELFPTRVRATATAFVFNTPRLIAWTGPLISGWLIANFGGFSTAAVAIATVYLISLAAAPFLPETRGKPLP